MSMQAHLMRVYAGTSEKGRALLAVLMHADTLTRRELAAELGQHRLYPHDDRALHRLEGLGVVYVTVHRIRDELAEMYQDNSIYQLRQIQLYTRYYRYGLMGSARPTIYKLMLIEGRIDPIPAPDFGLIGAAVDAVAPLLSRILR